MAYNTKTGLSTGASGAIAGGMVGGPIGAAVGGGVGLLAGFLPDGTTTSQVPLETPEQAAARKALMNFATSGRLGDFQAGAAIPGMGYGDYNLTDPEKTGLSTLQNLLTSGIPDQFRLGDSALRSYLATNPADVSAQFDPFKEQVQRQIGLSNRDLLRTAGVAGNLYSTDTIRKLGDVQARGNETLTSKLAELTDAALNRRLSAIPLAYQSGEAQQNAALRQVGASQQYGDLVRSLNDASIKARDQELLRRRQESELPLEALRSVAGTGSNFGIPSVTTSPYQDLLGMVGKIGGNALGNEINMAQMERKFPGIFDYGKYPSNMGPSWNG
jgi:hypothetical protein